MGLGMLETIMAAGGAFQIRLADEEAARLRQALKAAVMHRAADAAGRVASVDGFAQLGENFTGRGEVAIDVFVLMSQRGVETRTGEDAAFKHSHRKESF